MKSLNSIDYRFFHSHSCNLVIAFRGFMLIISLMATSAIVSYDCPKVNQTIPVLASQTVRLSRSPSDQLCILYESEDGAWAHVARSYDGYDWENVAGPYMTIPIDCTQTYCDIPVPTAKNPSVKFMLVSFDHSRPAVDVVARFLEQTTFGTTRADLESMRLQSNGYRNLPRAFANWLREQIYDVSKTSHREYWRRHMASRQIYGGHEGAPTHPCQAKSQWRRASFTEKDSYKIVQTRDTNGRFPLYVDGKLRTVVDRSFFRFNNMTYTVTSSINFTLCRIIDDFVGGSVSVKLGTGTQCVIVQGGNPPVNFESSDPQPNRVLVLPDIASGSIIVSRSFNATPENIFLVDSLSNDICAKIPQMICCNGQGSVFGLMSTGQYMIFEPRLIFRSNTIETPLVDGGGGTVLATDYNAQCANAPRTFLNEKYCFMSNSTISCSPSNSPDGSIVLSNTSITTFFNATTGHLYIYVIDGLRIEDDSSIPPPCTVGTISRWRRQQTDKCITNAQADTAALFQQLITQSTDTSTIIRDIIFPSQSSCNTLDMARKMLKIQIGPDCWITTHPDNLNVYDFTYWTLNGTHPGNTALTNPIGKFAVAGSSTLLYPKGHSMYRWNINKDIFKLIGRYNDTIAFTDLPDYLRQGYIADAFGLTSGPVSSGSVVCGSPGEVANLVESYPAFDITRSPEEDTASMNDFIQQRKTVWTMVVLQSPDQLRQRMAWALSQLLAVSPLNDPNTEIFLNYYDIFVRNAFGNYRDILREVAYSPIMAKMLTYLNSQSQSYSWESTHVLKYADENFAREIMQLFTIGLIQLNTDGSPIRDDRGNYIRMYTNDDIMEYSRVFTGFTRQRARGNYEERLGLTNNLDPLTINVNWRDIAPKMGLNNQYVGDKYMLCSDLPTRSFLRNGATYRLLGSSFVPELSTLLVLARGSRSLKVLELNQTSNLFRKLCGGGNCTAALSVVLDSNLPCTGLECHIDMIQVVKLTGNLFYEYVRPACVNFPIFNSGFMTMNAKGASPQCVDGRQAVAAELCCSSVNAIYNTCLYSGERVTVSTAKARCNAKNMNLCSAIPLPFPGGNCWNYKGNYFLDSPCGINILVSPEGKIAVEGISTGDFTEQMNTFFRVSWIDGKFPSVALNSCGAGLCIAVGRLCRCSTSVVDKAVFSSTPTRDQALSHLFVGGVPPNMFDNGTYTLRQITQDGIRVYHSSTKKIDNSTVFQLEDDFGRTMLLRNFQSMVYLKGNGGFFASSSYGFRNPPVFFGAVPNKGDALYETEAALDHLFFNENTAPFLALRFIQRLGGLSNPSPRYIQAVASAFRSGSYTFEDTDHSFITFGTNMYGDLAATTAAIILDRESRSVVLDADPSQGSLREPLLKVIAVMRNLEFKIASSSDFIILQDLERKIGQMAHDIPSVFSFFLPHYSPPSLLQTSLVSPESMLLTHSTGLMNGMISLIKFGLTSCFDGLGDSTYHGCVSGYLQPEISSAGWLSYTPLNPSSPTDVVNELSTLLTSGRMSTKNRYIVAESYASAKDGLRAAEQLIISAPEFHSKGLVKSSGTGHQAVPSPETCKSYKAIIHILLKGGCDSFNMLVPHSQCTTAGTDLYDNYQKIRGSIALAKETLLPIASGGNTQPCSVFGLHPGLESLQTLYDEGEALFFANIGALDRPVTKENFLQLTSTQLFAHDAMQAEIGKLDPFQSSMGTGFLGRIIDYLFENNYNVNAFAMDASFSNLAGFKPVKSKYSVQSSEGFRMYDPSSGPSVLLNQTRKLNDKGTSTSNVFSKLWSEALMNAIDTTNDLFWAQRRGNVSTEFPNSDVGRQMKLVAEMINSDDCRKSDRDIFYVEIPGYDHHNNVLNLLHSKFDELNAGLSAFVTEMKLRNKWKDVTIVSSSDFGRTLIGNSNEGTDHAWGGHSFIIGGSVKGKRILGQYPTDLSDDSPLSVGRGRFLPTLPWEAIWNAVAEWFDINDKAALDKVLPNRAIFASSLFHKDDIFTDVETTSPSCNRSLSISALCSPLSSNSSNPLGSQDSTQDGVPGGLDSSIYDSSMKIEKARGINVASWLMPLLFLIIVLAVFAFLRRRLKNNPRSNICPRLRSNRHSSSEPNVIFFNAIDPHFVEAEKGKTINIFDEHDDYWRGYPY